MDPGILPYFGCIVIGLANVVCGCCVLNHYSRRVIAKSEIQIRLLDGDEFKETEV